MIEEAPPGSPDILRELFLEEAEQRRKGDGRGVETLTRLAATTYEVHPALLNALWEDVDLDDESRAQVFEELLHATGFVWAPSSATDFVREVSKIRRERERGD